MSMSERYLRVVLSYGVPGLKPEVSSRHKNCAILSTWAFSLPLYVPRDTRQSLRARLLSDAPAVVVNNAPYPANRRRRRTRPVLLGRLFRVTLGTRRRVRLKNSESRRMQTYISIPEASHFNERALLRDRAQLRKLMELRRPLEMRCSSRML